SPSHSFSCRREFSANPTWRRSDTMTGRGDRREPALDGGSAGGLTALKDATLLALLTFGLSFPIVAFNTRQDLSAGVVLGARLDLVAAACAVVCLARVVWRLFGPTFWRGGDAVVQRAASLVRATGLSVDHVRWFGLAVLVTYPFLAVWVTGPGGAI